MANVTAGVDQIRRGGKNSLAKALRRKGGAKGRAGGVYWVQPVAWQALAQIGGWHSIPTPEGTTGLCTCRSGNFVRAPGTSDDGERATLPPGVAAGFLSRRRKGDRGTLQ